jgi:4-hydroxy-4-methyl-2-oxoglutarate aldolase
VLCDDSGVLILSPSEAEGEAKRAIERQEAGLAMQRRVQDGAKLGELSGATAKVVLGA